jgi:enoyl-CoA hydratase
MNGLVFGGGIGISLYGTHKVAGENYSFAMPEAGIGFFPDVGATYFLPRMPGKIGLYLALTGNRIGRADAYALGLLTHCIDSREFDSIREAMCEADPIDPVLDGRHADPGPSPLLEMQERIDRHFSAESVEGIVASLQGVSGADAEWARETAAKIGKSSPLGLKITFHQMRNFQGISLKKALELEARIARCFLGGEEFYEGIRAFLIDKDAKPKWSPATLEEVSDEMVEAFFGARENEDFEPTNPFT